MRTLCFGGSFNPIHHGHLICARAAAEALGFDRILLIPSAQPPHKPNSLDLAAAEHRLAMCQLAAELEPSLFHVSDMELKRVTPSYTIDSARALKLQGWQQVSWLIGADMLLYLPKWHEPEALLDEVNFVILARPGWTFDWSAMPEAYRHLEMNVVRAPLIEMSATDIRRRARDGRSIAYMVPPGVAEYIERHGLYKS
jgi:nicotinate-nucleotide adenylyltransferase